ncbi:Serine/arginine-rich SC35-like splicing factor SCL28, partial [Linum perenne]
FLYVLYFDELTLIREPRGFGFVKFRYAEDAAEAKDRMNHKVIGGREIRIVFAEENRKTPQEMTSTGRTSSRHGGSSRRRSPPRSPRRRYRSSSRSVSPPRNDISRDRGMKDDYRSSSRRSRSVSRSYSPVDERDHKSNQRSPSPAGNGGGGTPHGVEENPSRRSPSSRINDRSPSRSRSRSYE